MDKDCIIVDERGIDCLERILSKEDITIIECGIPFRLINKEELQEIYRKMEEE